jgi:hypothetical protein
MPTQIEPGVTIVIPCESVTIERAVVAAAADRDASRSSRAPSS